MSEPTETGWCSGKLGELLPIKYGKSLPERLRDLAGTVPVFGSSGRVGSHSEALTQGPALIVGRKGSVGSVYYSEVPCWPIDTVYYTEAADGQNLRYFKYLLDSLRLVQLDKSTAIPGLSRDDYSAVPVTIAPPDEQRRIVAEIEKQFSRLDEAVANLKRVKANLKRYKAAVLKAAVEGRLVPSEAGMLLGDETSSWMPIRLAIKSLDQGWSPQCESQASGNDNEWAVMKTTAVQPMMFLESENKRLPSSVTPRDHLELMAGDLLITRAGPRSRVGVSCLVRTTRPRVLLCDKVYRIRPRLEMAVPEYLEVVLNSPTILDSLDKMKTGISDSGLNLTQKGFSELLVPLPSLADQGRIVSEVDRLVSLVRGVEGEVEANLNRAEVLRRATLERVLEAPAMGGYSRRTQAANPAPETEPR